MGYPALVERALRLVEERGGAAPEGDLCAALFGATGGAWAGMLGQVLAADGRLRRDGDGCWRSGPAPTAAAAASVPTPPSAPAEPGATGLVVLAAGPKPWKHPIVAIGAARAGERFETLVRPELPCRVPGYLEKLGVRAEELDEAPTLDRALDALCRFVGAARLVGLDVGIAVARLQFALRQVGRAPLDNPTTELAVAGSVKPDLTALARARGVPVPPRLSAGALAALALALDTPGAEPGSALGSTAWRRLLDARALASIPATPGVYLFRDRGGRLLYAGKATSLRERLASYLTGQFALVRSMPGLVEATACLDHETLPCELAARVREAELIAAHRPTYNVQRRPDPALAWVALELVGQPTDDGAAVPRVRLRSASEPFEGAALGTVAGARAAFRRVRASWWPARPRRDLRPSPAALRERFTRLAGELAAEVRAMPVAPGLVAADLVGGLVVVAPRRPPRAAAAVEAGDDGWIRERHDRYWPPPEVVEAAGGEPPADAAGGATRPEGSAEMSTCVGSPGRPHPNPLPLGEGTGGAEPEDVAVGMAVADAGAVLVVGPDGLRAAAAIEGAAEGDAGASRDAPAGEPSAAGLAGLSVALAALRRGEACVPARPVPAR